MTVLDTSSETSLYQSLAERLPAGQSFCFHHISTPPTKCDPLFAPPPGSKPERTYCESHFLTVSANGKGQLILLFGIEVLVFTTKRLTTIFVSKADSTGCLASLNLPRGSGASIVRTVASELVSWLVETRQRPKLRLVVSLFARAQGQYLFPCSVDNKGKHVLDDRQLVKWWCKTLDPVLRKPSTSASSQAYVIVPGFDKVETAAFFPPTWRQDPVEARKWQTGHPLEAIARSPNLPPRCLIPHFPDDPKARYLDDLDQEIPDSVTARPGASPSKKGNGMWKSIKTLSQFWEMMAFRQECSAGRMVGFIWIVFTPQDLDSQLDDDNESVLSGPASPSPGSSFSDMPSIAEVMSQDSTKSSPRKDRTRKPLTGPVVARPPRIKKTSSNLSVSSAKEESAYWRWPASSRGQVVLETPQYTRIHDLLLKLDFSNDDAAQASTAKWLEEAATIVGDADSWGTSVEGKMAAAPSTSSGATAGTARQPNDLSTMIVRKKRKADVPPPVEKLAAPPESAPAVNVLGAGMIRKKPKT